MKRLLFIVNPQAGKKQIKNKVLEITSLFRANGYEVTLYPTMQRLDARDIVRDRGMDYDLIVCSGGDGTLDEVVTGMQMAGIEKPLGYIPAGSTNDYAKSLKIPANQILAAQHIVNGSERKVDLGVFGNRFFVYCAAFGLFTEVSYSTSQTKKNLLGHVAYVMDGATSLTTIKKYQMTVEWEGKSVSGEFIYGMVTNSLSVGGFPNIVGKQTKLDDGMFEVLLVRNPRNATELNNILAAFLSGDPTAEGMVFIKTPRIKFRFEGETPWSLDGEYGGSHREIEIVNQKQGLTLLT